MTIYWFDGISQHYDIPTGDEPDYPIIITEDEIGNYMRSYTGVMYNPTTDIFKNYSFSFTGISSVTVAAFISMFKVENVFNIVGVGFGNFNLLLIPNSLNVEYITLGNCNLSFKTTSWRCET